MYWREWVLSSYSRRPLNIQIHSTFKTKLFTIFICFCCLHRFSQKWFWNLTQFPVVKRKLVLEIFTFDPKGLYQLNLQLFAYFVYAFVYFVNARTFPTSNPVVDWIELFKRKYVLIYSRSGFYRTICDWPSLEEHFQDHFSWQIFPML